MSISCSQSHTQTMCLRFHISILLKPCMMQTLRERRTMLVLSQRPIASMTELHRVLLILHGFSIIPNDQQLNLRPRYSSYITLFFEIFGGHTCPFLGPLVPLFWISGNISSGFQIQSGFCIICIFVEVNVMYIPRDPPLTLHMLTSCWSATQLATSPHASAEVVLSRIWMGNHSDRRRTGYHCASDPTAHNITRSTTDLNLFMMIDRQKWYWCSYLLF